MSTLSKHQIKQRQVVDKIEEYFKSNKVSVVAPIDDFDTDPRICLTGVHFPNKKLINKIKKEIINPIKKNFPNAYYYKPSSLHMTIKNVKVIDDPPTFTDDDVAKVKKVFSETIPKHMRFRVYFYRLILFPNSLSLLGTTDPELDNIFFSLDQKLREINIPDNKKYVNKKYFFSNITLARFDKTPPDKFKDMVNKISNSLSFKPYSVNSVTLIVANASLTKCKKVDTWNL